MSNAARTDSQQTCGDCGFAFPLDRTTCPCCARPQIFPNVTLARRSNETKKLDDRLQNSLADADRRSCRAQVDSFSEDCRASRAVFHCSHERMHRQITSGTDLYASYHDLEALRLRTTASDGLDFSKLRPQAEIELFGSEKYTGRIHYACLTLNGQGLRSYGDCVVRLNESRIGHRATCFEGNSAVLFSEKRRFDEILRSDWENRHRLCTAVLASQVNQNTQSADHPTILVRPGDSAEGDAFIEVHIFGDMVAPTFESVHFLSRVSGRDSTYREAIEEKLQDAGVAVSSV